ncbi:MAG TPA: tRNA (guanosine(46)-N7)-methyltransferase TrmB [candidate division Zixibacteria bacterium]|nr:tRNA (guanosine(46)-N7)-methyltransferase TrmB [candidate division Zixibacteria bacterium]MDD4916278.1 tRNA (guanosine(46)-N7)-methyltransferase TrmB [candidate division Zixibacteria bacterium]MDM7973659.1 tRNA (guanosine(46)-N7)-methyltransferase TrmB [candidate division Zixibacteria bacterium]HOD67186.1 tRNA (guanosine(46)-N7)-methyltransferase TrmB [candidate division Zixibacteria bacterium]HOZ07174.1 tRNA (guanosine(46)-N7)-methyltransferase TrmB [candidate division Zixibacteria bacteriu
MKEFPWAWEERKEILVYPEGSAVGEGDILEIGPGRGDLLLSLAEALPEKQFVAVEIGKKRYYKLIPRIQKRSLANIQLICSDARIVLPRFYGRPAFEKIYVLFPDPWPKARHEFRRLLHKSFVELLAAVLRPDGDLFMATDVDWYAQWAVENAAAVAGLRSLGRPFVAAEALFSYAPTFFEQKWRAEGRPIYYMHYRRC